MAPCTPRVLGRTEIMPLRTTNSAPIYSLAVVPNGPTGSPSRARGTYRDPKGSPRRSHDRPRRRPHPNSCGRSRVRSAPASRSNDVFFAPAATLAAYEAIKVELLDLVRERGAVLLRGGDDSECSAQRSAFSATAMFDCQDRRLGDDVRSF